MLFVLSYAGEVDNDYIGSSSSRDGKSNYVITVTLLSTTQA